MEQSDWSRHIPEFGTSRCTQCYQTPFHMRIGGWAMRLGIHLVYHYPTASTILICVLFAPPSLFTSSFLMIFILVADTFLLNLETAGQWHVHVAIYNK